MTSPTVGSIRSAMTRRSVLLAQPDGPISEMNSPLAIERSMPWRAVVTTWSPRVKTLSTPDSRTTEPLDSVAVAVMRSPGSGGCGRSAAEGEQLCGAEDEEERD